MKSEQVLTLLGVMRDARGTVGGAELARALGMSQNAFKRELSGLRTDLAAHGCAIAGKTGRGNGYELVVSDPAAFDVYLHDVLPGRARSEGRDYNDPENRVHFIIWHLLAPDEPYVRMDDLAEEILVSRAQLSKDLAQVRDRLAYYGIRIVSRPKHGSAAEGDELAVRLCLSDTLREDFHVRGTDTSLSHLARPAYHRSELGRIEQIVIEEARGADYALTDAIIQNLMIHLYVALRRVKAGHVLSLEPELAAELAGAEELPLAERLAARLTEEFGHELGPDEVAYIAMHLSSKRVASAETLDPAVSEIVDAMLGAVSEAYRVDLTGDEQLRLVLGQHTAPLLKRLQYGLVFPNPLLEEIRTKLMFSYDVAACACEVINEAYGCRLAEDEVAYYALHFKVALEARRRAERRRVLAVTSGGRGNAELVRFEVEQNFGEQVGRVDACSAFELPDLDLSPYDCVLTTVPLTGELPLPCVRVSPLFDDESVRAVREVLSVPQGHAAAGHYFLPELFFGGVHATTREEAIREVCERMTEAADVPADLAGFVLAREELQATRFGAIAVPAARGVVADHTAIGVAVLDAPVAWDGGEVQVVVLLSLGEDFVRHNRGFYSFLRELISDSSRVARLVRDPRYETLITLFAESM